MVVLLALGCIVRFSSVSKSFLQFFAAAQQLELPNTLVATLFAALLYWFRHVHRRHVSVRYDAPKNKFFRSVLG